MLTLFEDDNYFSWNQLLDSLRNVDTHHVLDHSRYLGKIFRISKTATKVYGIKF